MIYYLEDDEQIRNLALYTLAQTGHDTRGFSNAAEMYEALDECVPDLFLLDVMLPGEDGITVVGKLRQRPDTADVPVMMLTAKSTEFDTVVGLDAGADDYLAKPFGMMELLSRVNALLRRAQRSAERAAQAAKNASPDHISAPEAEPLASAAGAPLVAGDIVLDPARYHVAVCGQEVHLTNKEFEMLRYLMENRGLVLSRSQMLDQVWGYQVAGETRTVDAHVQTLRKKLGEANPDAPHLIETVRGVGYRLKD